MAEDPLEGAECAISASVAQNGFVICCAAKAMVAPQGSTGLLQRQYGTYIVLLKFNHLLSFQIDTQPLKLGRMD
eukprot:scaffold22056_cov60-Cyclotella_meneghiniana.AAC.9